MSDLGDAPDDYPGSPLEPDVSARPSVLPTHQLTRVQLQSDPDHDSLVASSELSRNDWANGDRCSSTVSVRDSVFQFVEENGRTYHSFAAGCRFPSPSVARPR